MNWRIRREIRFLFLAFFFIGGGFSRVFEGVSVEEEVPDNDDDDEEEEGAASMVGTGEKLNGTHNVPTKNDKEKFRVASADRHNPNNNIEKHFMS